MRELEESGWLARQIEAGIARYVQKTVAAQRAAQADEARKAAERAKAVRPPSPDRDHIRGDPAAELSLIEYSDFECPFCKRYHETARQFIEESGSRVNWVYRHLPLAFHEPAATAEAEAAECAFILRGDKGFWGYADATFQATQSNGAGYARQRLLDVARHAGVPHAHLRKCIASRRTASRVKEDVDEAARLGITGTPTTILLNNRTGEVQVLNGAVALADLRSAADRLSRGAVTRSD